MKYAANVAVAGKSGTKQFTEEQFRLVMRSSFFTGAVAFWRSLERLASPEPLTRVHAMGVLTEMARQAYKDCGGYAYSPVEYECFKFCGLIPKGLRPPGAAAMEERW